MKKLFTKSFSTAALAILLLAGLEGKAQTQPTPADTAAKDQFKPSGRVWGYSFGDYYFAQHSDATNRGAETNYNGVPANRNAFQIRRVYLGYDYDISKKFSAELLLAAEPSASNTIPTGGTVVNADNLGDNKLSFYIKLINLRWKGVWSGTDFVIGQMSTPAFSLLEEKVWGYRSIEKTVADFHKTNSYDLGAALQGVFDPATKNFGYNVMIGNNSQATLGSAATPSTGFFKEFYGDLFAKFLDKKLIFDIYGDYAQTSSTLGIVGQQSHNMFKGFVAYTTPQLTVGVEAYTNNLKNAVTQTNSDGSKKVVKATAQAVSAFVRGIVYKDKVGFFARYDGYTPDNNFNSTDVLNASPISSYNLYTKERFVTAGLDFTPAKNIHFMPNIWFIQYKDERAKSTATAPTGYVADGHVLVYRLTFFYTFGK